MDIINGDMVIFKALTTRMHDDVVITWHDDTCWSILYVCGFVLVFVILICSFIMDGIVCCVVRLMRSSVVLFCFYLVLGLM